MLTEVWETCAGFPGFSRDECASWVQAWGSIIAIAAAVIIAWWQRRADRLQAVGNARVRAELAGAALLLKAKPILGVLQAVEDLLRRASREAPIRSDELAQMLSVLDYPHDREILVVLDHDRVLAHQLVRARTFALQSVQSFQMLHRYNETEKMLHDIRRPQLLLVLQRSQEEFSRAIERLQALVPAE